MPNKKNLIREYIGRFQMLPFVDEERYFAIVCSRLSGAIELHVDKESMQSIFIFDEFTKQQIDSIIDDINFISEITEQAATYENLHWLLSVVPELFIANRFVSRIKGLKVVKEKTHLIYDLH